MLMKKHLGVFILLITLFLTGCSLGTESLDFDFGTDYSHHLVTDYSYNLSAEIIRCFNEKDSEGLKSLFCTNTQNYYNMDSEILNTFNCYNGVSESYSVKYASRAGDAYKDGKMYDEHFRPKITNIVTDTGNIYSIEFTAYSVHDYDPGWVGIGVIVLYDSEENVIAVIGGYDWI
jgi:hypothetical protein